MRKEVFKVQTSLNGKKKHLVYNEQRTYFGEFPFDDILYSLVGNKGFVFGYVNNQGKLVVQRKLKKEEFPTW